MSKNIIFKNYLLLTKIEKIARIPAAIKSASRAEIIIFFFILHSSCLMFNLQKLAPRKSKNDSTLSYLILLFYVKMERKVNLIPRDSSCIPSKCPENVYMLSCARGVFHCILTNSSFIIKNRKKNFSKYSTKPVGINTLPVPYVCFITIFKFAPLILSQPMHKKYKNYCSTHVKVLATIIALLSFFPSCYISKCVILVTRYALFVFTFYFLPLQKIIE